MTYDQARQKLKKVEYGLLDLQEKELSQAKIDTLDYLADTLANICTLLEKLGAK